MDAGLVGEPAGCEPAGANWPEDDWAEITDEVVLNIYTDMDGKRKATAFQKIDGALQFGVDISYVGDGLVGHDVTQGLDGYNKTLTGDVSPTVTAKRSDLHHVPGVVSTNSNGEDVAATLTRDLAKQTGAQQQNGGGYVLTRREEGAHDGNR